MIKYPGRQGWFITWKYDIWCESCLSKPTTVYYSHWLQLKTFQAPKNRLPEGPFKEKNLQGDWRRKSGVEKQKMYKWISSLFSLTSHDHVNLGNRAAGVQSKDWEKPFIMVRRQRKVNPVSQKVGVGGIHFLFLLLAQSCLEGWLQSQNCTAAAVAMPGDLKPWGKSYPYGEKNLEKHSLFCKEHRGNPTILKSFVSLLCAGKSYQ